MKRKQFVKKITAILGLLFLIEMYLQIRYNQWNTFIAISILGLYLGLFVYANVLQPMYRQKNARCAGTQASKVIPFKNNSITIIDNKERSVKSVYE